MATFTPTIVDSMRIVVNARHGKRGHLAARIGQMSGFFPELSVELSTG